MTFRRELPLFWDHGDGIHNISPPYGPWGSKFPSQWAVTGISGGDGFVWLVVMNVTFIFPYIGNVIIPID